MFLTKTDILAVAKDSAIAQIDPATFPPPSLVTAERFATDEAIGYLNFKYDTTKIFAVQAFDFDNSVAYKTGQVIIEASGVAYNCIADAPAGTALTNASFFALGDLRNSLIVMLLVDLMLYHFYSRLPSNRINQTRILRYEQAIEKLKEIRKSRLNPELPLRDLDSETLPDTQTTQTIEIISQPKRNNNY